MKKVIIFTACMALACICLKAQKKVMIGFKLSPNAHLVRVIDADGTPSGTRYAADGLTTREGNQNGISAGVNFDLPLNGPWYFGTGVWFTSKKIFIRNSDGGYSGTSVYQQAVLQIPLLAKYRTGQLFLKNMNLAFSGGGAFDLKIAESLKGGDGAHYWNLSRNNYYSDPTRGRNGDNRSMQLFSPFNLGLYLSAGAEYKITEKFMVYAGFSYQHNFLNLINPALKFNDAAKTPVRNDIKIKGSLLSFDLAAYLR